MTPDARRALISWAALAAGAVLFVVALYYIDFHLVFASGPRLGVACLYAVAASGAWHLARTWAWSWCFSRPRAVTFGRLARVRLAAEAFSYLTLRGIAGEPLKVVLLGDEVDAHEATAAVALERLAYLVGTTLIVGIGSAIAIGTLPLSPLWFRVFRGFAIVAGATALVAAVVLTGRGGDFFSTIRRLDRGVHTRMSERRVTRFIGDVERLLLDLVRGNSTRLVVLVGATLAAYVCMCVEAWAILRAMGIPISVGGAVAIETFSRVASFASAFVPANLGALEASSVAAVAVVGASAAAGPLALARRLRGIFWAGVGLTIYPRRRRFPTVRPTGVTDNRETPGRTLLYLPMDRAVAVSPLARVAGLPIAQRVLRAAYRARYRRVIVLIDQTIEAAMRWTARECPGETRLVRADQWRDVVASLPDGEVLTAIGAGTVVSTALFEEAAARAVGRGTIRDVPAGDGWPVSGLLRLDADGAADLTELSSQLHSRSIGATPLPTGEDISHARGHLALRILDDDDLTAAEQTIRRASYKATDNKVARFNRRLSLPISIALIRTPITANQLSVALVALGFFSAWLFSLGRYGPSVLAGFLSLAASVLDGCDGEIARLKYQESALGCWIETFGDYSYYIAVFAGMTIGSVRSTGMPAFYWVGAIALAGTLIAFALLIYLRSRITGGEPEKLHAIAKARFKAKLTPWSRLIWKISFVATRSAMPYGIFALSLLGLIPLVVVLAAIGANTYWISLVLKLKHLLVAEAAETVPA